MEDISSVLAESSGSDFSHIDPRPIIKLMEDYKSESCDWSKYAFRNQNQSFTRNLVDNGNGKHNLVGQI